MAPRKKRLQGGVSAIPTESFADLAFLLIVFFLLATTLQQTDGFLAEIPAGQAAEESSEDTMPTVRILPDGLRWDDEPVTIPELRLFLRDLALPERAEEERVIILQASGEVEYQRYFEVMALISASGGAIAIMEGD